jgi:hypothetical protein
MRTIIGFLGVLLLIIPMWAMAGIYDKTGLTMSFVADTEVTEGKVFYSKTADMALGYHYVQMDEEESPFHMLQANWRIQHWDNPDAQANIYFLTGLGVQDEMLGGYLGLKGERESNRFYLAASAEQFAADSPMTRLVERLGVAPYIADEHSLHLWLMLQATQIFAEDEDESFLMPVVRVFKGNVLVEFGTNGDDSYGALSIGF